MRWYNGQSHVRWINAPLLWLYCDRSSNNLSRTLEHARSNAAAELPQWRNQLERTACELAGGPSDPPFVHDLPLWRNQLERTACQANPRHGSSSVFSVGESPWTDPPSACCSSSSRKSIPGRPENLALFARTINLHMASPHETQPATQLPTSSQPY